VGRTVTVGSENDEPENLNMNDQNQKNPTPIEHNLNKKRKASDNLTMTVEDDGNSFSRFLVITANNHEPIEFSIFAIQKLLK
jgi:hypothetical protein